ncbi:isoprenyl transferase [Corynebacterium lujinxingii]|uniref:Isoprenyl transferase n=1 Tax=Corynebacterium lujinxingii TaxID=2763010 RepID=A0A7H0JXJ0_9CORY|nr:isoprenyl transferase [Corynebacterium lujinxingii]MBC3177803.1 isoprenyl transferase [Corynebacterium lujinxingii]NNO09952.1 isoprenyl transferase [Corynebacterium lujinxingii]QNP89756.1 isoprenyl transferase [Corynebacterium lujinxingii]
MGAPQIDKKFIPKHIALVMDGNGRWAQQRGLKRTEGHKVGEEKLMDAVDACIELGGVEWLSAYAFSTENWKRSPSEVHFLMNFTRDVLRRQRDELHAKNVRVVWCGRRPKLWGSVIEELEVAQELTKHNTGLTLAMCVNYGGRAEITDAVQALIDDHVRHVDEKTLQRYLYHPEMPDVDLFLRPSGEQRTSNFLLWQSAYAEMVYQDVLFPDFTKQDLWDAVLEYAKRDRRFGGAVDKFDR